LEDVTKICHECRRDLHIEDIGYYINNTVWTTNAYKEVFHGIGYISEFYRVCPIDRYFEFAVKELMMLVIENA
jgi:hypothetical protein